MVGLRVTVGLYGRKGNSRVEFEDSADVGDAELLPVDECESVSHAFSFSAERFRD
jgi:hypothetical protein